MKNNFIFIYMAGLLILLCVIGAGACIQTGIWPVAFVWVAVAVIPVALIKTALKKEVK